MSTEKSTAPLSFKSGSENGLIGRFLFHARNLPWGTIGMRLERKFRFFRYRKKKFKKPDWMVLNVAIVGKCNLNCVACNAFAPVADDYKLSVESFESDCKRLSELGGKKIREIIILGGEPLLHPRLTDFLNIARSYFPHAELRIITNGTLLLKQGDNFWNCCKSNKVRITITHYPVKLDVKAIKAALKKHGIVLWYYPRLSWFKIPFDLNGNGNPHENFKKCSMALQCPELRDGKIAACQIITKVHYFDNYFQKNLKTTDADLIDIYKAESIDEILKFIANPAPFCKYCNVEGVPLEWGVSQRDISEWALQG